MLDFWSSSRILKLKLGDNMGDLDPSVAAIAIEAMEPTTFEIFGQFALSEVLGIAFEPTGGHQDGGQDGFLRKRYGRPNHFVQISKEKDVRGKIRRTINRLKEGGRAVEYLTFLSRENFPTRDDFETEIERETGVQLRLHDRSWISMQISKSSSLREVLAQRASGALRSASEILGSTVQNYAPGERMSVLVYMDAHARSSPQETDLLTLAVDAAIYQALEGTDPDKGVFKTESEVLDFVEKRFPAVKNRPSFNIGVRLDKLSAKKNNPRIRQYTKERKFCLPYDVRNELSQENDAIKRLELEFLESIRARACRIDGVSAEDALHISSAVLYGIVKTFEKQGMNLAASFDAVQRYDDVFTYEFIREKIIGLPADNVNRQGLLDVALEITRQVFYSGNEIERRYIIKVFKLFSVEFVLNGDERVASYFKSMVKNLKLYVGADMIIRALSESCLQSQSRAMQNALSLLSKAGAQMLMTEHVLNEVYTHIIAENKEFEGHYQPWIAHATPEFVINSDRILIRAFFYAYFYPDRHDKSYKSWRLYLEQFGSSAWFDSRGSAEDFCSYLMKKFGFEFVSEKKINSAINDREVSKLKSQILSRRSTTDLLAENDAKISLYVNNQREIDGEKFSTSVYGYRTWWLTEEFQVVQAAQDLKIPHRFAMHPQFLMNFFVAAPGLRSIADDASGFFPTSFGLRITDRVDEGALRDFLRQANQAAVGDEAAAHAKIRSLSNKMKATNFQD